jgi:hypothetical protein
VQFFPSGTFLKWPKSNIKHKSNNVKLNPDLLITILILIIVILFFKLLHGYDYAKIKGAEGESIVANRLKKLHKKKYVVINNILINTGNYTSQIDHVVISIYGIFVIETKHYNGWIHGHQNSEYWSQTFKKKKNSFKNPVQQNIGHIKALNKVLKEFKPIVYHPIVVFTGNAELKNVYTKTPVIYAHRLNKTIKSISHKEYFSEEDLAKIKNKLIAVSVPDKEGFKEHLKQIYHLKKEQETLEKLGLCPRCKEVLQIKHGQYGKFLACSNYPDCRYTKNI